tara:strand:+ start:43 stop:375 length:333 start_codon:yes stop_codon:yes gene_type:complete
MTPRETMFKKFEVMEDLELTSNLLTIQENVWEWCKAKPDNKKLNQVRDAIVRISLISNKMQLDKGNYHLALEQYRHDSLRAIERARAAEGKIDEIQKQLDVYKKKEELGL